MKKCSNCNSTEIETDISRGDEICTNCGSVLSDNLIISEGEFSTMTKMIFSYLRNLITNNIVLQFNLRKLVMELRRRLDSLSQQVNH